MSQVPKADSPLNCARCLNADRSVSCTKSSANSRFMTRPLAYLKSPSPYRPTHSAGSPWAAAKSVGLGFGAGMGIMN